ncbi:alpha/beta hydrolase [Sporosarcina sp. Marseille-Q4943]|uniref:alpha/beta hydrolase n=1 Tax=Sporosarcina sp. Marseille-Q4943 TaxID=2942204 RepID=UPI00208DA856|nr:alpha/beta fold hydrolase [Sporosarcina sp. Marseille-Q4943]
MGFHVENKEVVIKSDVLLKGTLTLPSSREGKLPAILILAGSGKLNRDANAEKGKFQFNIYKELAEHLSTIGFATLRYDKRGVGESEGNFEKTGLWDAVTDAANALGFLASHPDIDPHRLIVVGHSEGCIVGTALYAKRPFHGLVLLSGGGGGLRESLDLQRHQLYSELKHAKGLQGFIIRKFNTLDKSEKQAQATYRKLTTSNKDVIRIGGLFKMPAKYYREHFDFDIVEGLQQIACPVLAINGSKDFQSSVEFAKRIPENVKGPSTCIVVENMDHGLKEQLTPLSASTYKKDYIKTIGKPIHADAIKYLDAWLHEWKEGSFQVAGEN